MASWHKVFFCSGLFGFFIGLGAPAALAQNALDLVPKGNPVPGSSISFEVLGQDPGPSLLKLLAIDFDKLRSPLNWVPFGDLHLPLSPNAIYLVGDSSNVYSLGIPDVPSLLGYPIYTQAFGPPLGQPFGSLALSDLEKITFSSVPQVVRFVHALCLLDGTLTSYAVESESGRLRARGFTQVAALPSAVSTSPDGQFTWVVDGANLQVRGFRNDSKQGSLEFISAVPCDPGTSLIRAHPGGNFVLTASGSTDRVRLYKVDLASGALIDTQVSSDVFVTDPTAIECDALGNFVYVLSSASQSVQTLRLDLLAGTLNATSAYPTLAEPSHLLLSAAGKFGLVGSANSGAMAAYFVSPKDGSWTPMPAGTQVLSEGLTGAALVELAALSAVYVSEPASGLLHAYALDDSTGTFQSLTSIPASSGITALLGDRNGASLIASDAIHDELLTFKLGTDGLPSLASRIRTRLAPIALSAARGTAPLHFITRSVVVAHEQSGELRAYQMQAETGQLIDLGGGTFATQPAPVQAALSPAGDLVVTADFGGDGLTRFAFDTTIGQLGSPLSVSASMPFDVSFEPSGRYLYATSVAHHSVLVYERTGSQFTILQELSLGAGSFPRGLEVDPTGRFLYVASSIGHRIEILSIDPSTGILIQEGSTAVSGDPVDVVVHPSGRSLYAISATSNRLTAYAVDTLSGSLAALLPVGLPIASQSAQIAIEPSGRYLYVASPLTDSIGIYRLDQDSGTPEPLGGSLSPVAVPGDPRALAVDASGHFLFVSLHALNALQTLAIDPLTGGLSFVSQSPSGGAGPRGMAVGLELE